MLFFLTVLVPFCYDIMKKEKKIVLVLWFFFLFFFSAFDC